MCRCHVASFSVRQWFSALCSVPAGDEARTGSAGAVVVSVGLHRSARLVKFARSSAELALLMPAACGDMCCRSMKRIVRPDRTAPPPPRVSPRGLARRTPATTSPHGPGQVRRAPAGSEIPRPTPAGASRRRSRTGGFNNPGRARTCSPWISAAVHVPYGGYRSS